MTFDPATPFPNEEYYTPSQEQLKVNFQQINTVYGTDHYAYDAGTVNAGRHKGVRLKEQASEPNADPGEYVLFCKEKDGELTACVKNGDNGHVLCVGDGTNPSFFPALVVAVKFDDQANIIGTPLNVASVVKTGSGSFTVTFTSAVSSNAIPMGNFLTDNVVNGVAVWPFTFTTGDCVVEFTADIDNGGTTANSTAELLVWEQPG